MTDKETMAAAVEGICERPFAELGDSMARS
jgi:hypothetical protein